MSVCKACGAGIWFITMKSGVAMPVNENPVPFIPGAGKRKYIVEDGSVIEGKDWHKGDEGPMGFGYISHFATCPKAEQFRKRGKRHGEDHSGQE